VLTNSIPSAEETDIAAEIAHRAMAIGWFASIQQVSKEKGIDPLICRNILNKVSAFQAKEDPHGRIDELASWNTYRASGESVDIKPRTPGTSVPPVASKEVLLARLDKARKALEEKRSKQRQDAQPAKS
jgi:hypothetical protein